MSTYSNYISGHDRKSVNLLPIAVADAVRIPLVSVLSEPDLTSDSLEVNKSVVQG